MQAKHYFNPVDIKDCHSVTPLPANPKLVIFYSFLSTGVKDHFIAITRDDKIIYQVYDKQSGRWNNRTMQFKKFAKRFSARKITALHNLDPASKNFALAVEAVLNSYSRAVGFSEGRYYSLYWIHHETEGI
jgi:hypothetical protein